ncbi:hypothetical protein X801_00251, partial [Opisthorchis viverrini]
ANTEVVRELALTCQNCANNPHKYRCPRCNYKTCSLTCCLEHKQKFGCSGVRDAVVLCSRQEYGAFAFQQDYKLLEEIDRNNEFREKHLAKLSVKNKSEIRRRKDLMKFASENGIALRLASPLLSRSSTNRSRVVTDDKKRKISWSVEFSFLPINRSQYTTCNDNLARLKPLRLVVHDCDESARLVTIWNEKILQLESSEQDALVTYAPPGTPPFGLVTSWLYAKVKGQNMAKHFFYVQVEHFEAGNLNTDGKLGVIRKFVPVEVFLTNKLSHILITPRLIVHEMPTLWVSRKPLG